MSRDILTFIISAASLLLGGCANPMLWQDATGQGRGSPEFTVDNGRCRLVAQNFANQQQALVNQQNSNGCSGSSKQCGMLGLIQGIGINAASTNAYNACMNEHGWGVQSIESASIEAQSNSTIAPQKSEIEIADSKYADKDYLAAFILYKKLAEQGDEEAEMSLGNMYFSGKGIPKDYPQALYWYKKLAQNGNKAAQRNVAIMHELGYDVERNQSVGTKPKIVSDTVVSTSDATLSKSNSVADRLRALKALYKDGVINQRIYESRKKEILDSM